MGRKNPLNLQTIPESQDRGVLYEENAVTGIFSLLEGLGLNVIHFVICNSDLHENSLSLSILKGLVALGPEELSLEF